MRCHFIPELTSDNEVSEYVIFPHIDCSRIRTEIIRYSSAKSLRTLVAGRQMHTHACMIDTHKDWHRIEDIICSTTQREVFISALTDVYDVGWSG